MPAPRTRSTTPVEETEEDLRSRTDARYERLASEEGLMKLAADLVALSEKSLPRLGLSEELVTAIENVRRISASAARNRAMRVVRMALRDGDAAEIRKRYDRLVDPRTSAHVTFDPTPAEKGPVDAWCERLVAEGDGAVAEFVEEFPAADRQQLRALVRNAQKAAKQPEAASGRKQSLHALAKLVREHAG